MPGMPQTAPRAGQSGKTASASANGRARLSVMTVPPASPGRPTRPAGRSCGRDINSLLNPAITRQTGDPARSVAGHLASQAGQARQDRHLPGFRFLISQVRRPLTPITGPTAQLPGPHAPLRFPHAPALRRCPARRGGLRRARCVAGQLPRQRVAAENRRCASWYSTAATANGGARSPRAGKRRLALAHRRAHPAADRRARSALPVRAAQTCAPRLHGAEGGRDGRVPPAAGHHPARPGRARQPRAHARQCDRGRRAVRHPDAPRDRARR